MMDPTESILSTLNFTFDSFNNNDDFGFYNHHDNQLSSFLSASTNDLIINDFYNDNHFNDDHLFIDTINDQLSFPSSLFNVDDDHFSTSTLTTTTSTMTNSTTTTTTSVTNSTNSCNSNKLINQYPSIFKQQQQTKKLKKFTNTTTITPPINFQIRNSNPTVSILKTSSSRNHQRSKLFTKQTFNNDDISEAAFAAAVIANETTMPMPMTKPLTTATTTTIKSTRPTLSMMITPKVYVSQKSSSNKKDKDKGTSILLKQQHQSKRSNLNRKRTSLLFSSTTTTMIDSTTSTKPISVLMQCSSPSSLLNKTEQNIIELASLIDHDYCSSSTMFVPSTIKNNNLDNNEKNDINDNNNCRQKTKATANEIDDILNGYCPDDVMLKELPECLSDLIDGLNDSGDDIMNNNNTDDLLNHLSDACNIMTEQYLEEAFSNQDGSTTLPDLNLTEEDLNQVIDSCYHEEKVTNVNDLKEHTDDDTNQSNIDNDCSDAVSISTGCTDDSSTNSDLDKKRLPPPPSSSSSFIRLKNQFKSKRNRSLSSSSTTSTMILTTNKRKRRFSTRSSVNSSDASASESSLSESSNSRSSSPERAFNLAVNFTPNAHHNYHYKNSNINSNTNAKSNYNKYQWMNKKKHRIEMNMDKGKQWTKAYSKNILKKQKQQASTTTISSTLSSSSLPSLSLSLNRNKCRNNNNNINNNQRTKKQQQQQNYIDINGSSHSYSNNNNNNVNDNNIDKKLLYIGNIPNMNNGIKQRYTKNDIRFWFEKFGIIDDVQMFQKQSKTFAFVRYRNGQSIADAIKYGNDDTDHPKFTLSYAEIRKKHHNDLDYTEKKLDFRINDRKLSNDFMMINNSDDIVVNDDEDFDTLLRSAKEAFKVFD